MAERKFIKHSERAAYNCHQSRLKKTKQNKNCFNSAWAIWRPDYSSGVGDRSRSQISMDEWKFKISVFHLSDSIWFCRDDTWIISHLVSRVTIFNDMVYDCFSHLMVYFCKQYEGFSCVFLDLQTFQDPGCLNSISSLFYHLSGWFFHA